MKPWYVVDKRLNESSWFWYDGCHKGQQFALHMGPDLSSEKATSLGNFRLSSSIIALLIINREVDVVRAFIAR